jgi:hypothetical protein
MKRFAVRFLLLFALLNLLLFACACSTAWTTEAVNIINVLTPAIESALAILAAFGAGISPGAISAIDAWGQQATNDLKNVIAPLIQQYNAAVASAQPGILQEIEAGVTVILNNLSTVLPTLHVTDPATDAKIQAVITAIEAELTSLMNLIPVVQGKVTDHDQVKALLNKLKSAKAFKSDYNAKAGVFGKQFEIR